MSETTTSRIPPASHPHQPPYPQYPAPPGMRPDMAFVPAPRPPRGSQRRWPGLVGVAVASAAVAAAVTALITSQVVRTDSASGRSTAPAVTVTATPAAPAPTAPLPAAQADRQTCDTWHSAGDKIHAATKAQSVIPPQLTVVSQEVRDNPEWTAAVHQAADFYSQAADVLAAGVAPGTTPVLDQSAASMVAALRTLSTSYGTFDPAGGNAYHVMHEASDEMDVRCERVGR